MVGGDGAHAAWLLARHADQDPAFQRRCLELLTQAVASGEAAKIELAYLTDRVLAEGKPQEYGTQFVGGFAILRMWMNAGQPCRLERSLRTPSVWWPSTARRRQ
jgi:Family of unknown function (DUF6624)